MKKEMKDIIEVKLVEMYARMNNNMMILMKKVEESKSESDDQLLEKPV